MSNMRSVCGQDLDVSSITFSRSKLTDLCLRVAMVDHVEEARGSHRIMDFFRQLRAASRSSQLCKINYW